MNINTLNLLNETTLRCLNETDENKIIGTFTELAISVLEADFGFVWMSIKNQGFDLVYKSHALPYVPHPPTRIGRNIKVFSNLKPDFVSTIHKKIGRNNANKYMKSFVIIPIAYRKNVYGNIVICFKKFEKFSPEKKISCALIGSNIANVMTIFRNKKTLKENEEYRRKMKEEELRTEFLADAMHEIRTPLAIIKGTIDLAMKPGRVLNQSVAIKAIDTEVKHLTELLFELSLLTSKNSLARRNIQTKKTDLATFMINISKRWIPLAKRRGIVIKMKKIMPISILADESYLNKLFTNIVKNAVTYGKNHGHIFISANLQKDMIRIDIQDNGIGISKENIGRIFDRFYRVDKSRSNLNGHNETGLGLSITKWIAEAHGGKVTVKSTLGKGSTFSVFLPTVSKEV